MSDLPFGATDAPSADGWFSGLAESLEELLGAQGAQAVLSRALEDARRTWPQLSRASIGQNRGQTHRVAAAEGEIPEKDSQFRWNPRKLKATIAAWIEKRRRELRERALRPNGQAMP